MNVVNDHNFLDYFIDRYLNLDWYDYIPVYLDYFGLLNNVCYDFLNLKHSWYLFCLYHNSIMENVLSSYWLFESLIGSQNLSHYVNWLLYLDVNVSRNLNLNKSFLNNWNLHSDLNLFYNFLHDDFFNYFFNYLRDLNNFLNNSWDYNNFLNNSLDFNDFWNFYNFLYIFLNNCGDRFYSFNDSLYGYNLLLSYIHGLVLLDNVVYNFFHLKYSILVDYFWLFDLDLLKYNFLKDLYDWFLYVLFLYSCDFLNDWHLNYLLNYVFDGAILNNWNLLYNLNLLYSIFVIGSLSYYLDLHNLFYCVIYLDDFLHNLRDLHYPLFNLQDWDNLFNDPVHWLITNLDMVFNLRSRDILNSLDYFLDYFLNFNNFWNLNPHLYDFLDDSINWYRFLDDSLSWYHHFTYKLNISILNIIDNNFPDNLDNFLYFYHLLDYLFNLHYFWNLSYHFDYFFYIFWHLDNFLNYLWNLD